MNQSGIYKIVNVKNSKCYVGSAVNIKRRWTEHKSYLRGNKHHSKHLQRAFDIYGEDSFLFEIVELVEPQFLIEREQHWIDILSAYGKNGYNANPKAHSSLGIIRSSETREKISQSKKGGIPWNKGIKTGTQKPEVVERRVASRRGISRPDAVKEKISKTKRESGIKPIPATWMKSAEVRTRNAELRKQGLLPPLYTDEQRKKLGATISAAKKAAFAARKAAQLLNS